MKRFIFALSSAGALAQQEDLLAAEVRETVRIFDHHDAAKQVQSVREAVPIYALAQDFQNTMIDEQCDPIQCHQWDCRKWCTCFHFVPKLESWFAKNKALQEKLCPDDGSEMCDCDDMKYDEVKKELAVNEKGITDDIDRIIEDKNCCKLCKDSKACGNRCVSHTSKEICPAKGCACQTDDLITLFSNALGHTMESQQLKAEENEVNSLAQVKRKTMEEAVSIAHTKIGVCYAYDELVSKEIASDSTSSQAVKHCREYEPERPNLPCVAVAKFDGSWHACTHSWERGQPEPKGFKAVGEWGNPGLLLTKVCCKTCAFGMKACGKGCIGSKDTCDAYQTCACDAGDELAASA